MPNPNSGILDLRGGGTPSLVPDRHAAWPEVAQPASRLKNAVREMAIRFLAWRARQQTVSLLSSLDAATLRDIGITDIESAVYGDPQERVRPYDPDWWRTRW